MRKKKSKSRLRKVATGNQPPPPDVSVGVGELVLNNFLVEHYAADPDFYKREKEPIWQIDLPARNPPRPGEVDRTFKIFGRVMAPVQIDLTPTGGPGTVDDEGRFRAWWATRMGRQPTKDMPIPPNVVLRATVLLILEFTNRANPSKPHRLDYQFNATVGAYLSLENDEAGRPVIRARDWDVFIESLGVGSDGKPVDKPGDRIGRTSGNSDCEESLAELRNKITDLFDFGANYAISKLTSDLTTSLPLPPLANLIKAVDLIYDDLRVENNSLNLGAWARPTQGTARIKAALDQAVANVNSVFTRELVNKITEEAPIDSAALDKWMSKNIAEYKRLREDNQALERRSGDHQSPSRSSIPDNAAIRVTTDGTIFDIIAKKYLSVSQEACKSVFDIDLLAVYGNVSVCYRVKIWNAKGGINTNKIFMGCEVDVAGWGTASVCLRNPCGKDPCASYSLGIGLKGPLLGGLTVNTKKKRESGDETQMLEVSGFCDEFPGMYIIGLPSIIADIINGLLNAVTKFLFQSFLNELLKNINFYVVSIPVAIPGTNVIMNIRDFDVETKSGTLTLKASPRFARA